MESLFNPKSIVFIGISREESSAGYQLLKNLTKGCTFYSKYCKPFQGKVFVVSNDAEYILGFKCYPTINKIPEQVDVAFIFDLDPLLKSLVDCVKKNISYVFLCSETIPKTEEKIKKLIYKKKTRILGYSAGGIFVSYNNLNAVAAPIVSREGSVSFLSQSEDLFYFALNWHSEDYFSFNKLVQYGKEIDIDVSDLLLYLGNDNSTKSIALFVDEIKDGQKFLHIAKEVAKKKPLIILKGGEKDNIYDVAFKQVGAYVVHSPEELFEIAHILAYQPRCENALCIVTNSKSMGTLAQNLCTSNGIILSSPKENLLKKSNMPFVVTNPLVVSSSMQIDLQKQMLDVILKDDSVKCVLFIQVLQSKTMIEEYAKMILQLKKEHATKPFICVGFSGKYSDKAKLLLDSDNILDFLSLEEAVRATRSLMFYKYK